MNRDNVISFPEASKSHVDDVRNLDPEKKEGKLPILLLVVILLISSMAHFYNSRSGGLRMATDEGIEANYYVPGGQTLILDGKLYPEGTEVTREQLDGGDLQPNGSVKLQKLEVQKQEQGNY